jgi:alanine dehydrogenase
MVFDLGYGEPYGFSDEHLTKLGYRLADRDEIISGSHILLLPKPVPADLLRMKRGATLWGWCHCVQQVPVAEAAIRRELTLISWEAMNLWNGPVKLMHIFHKNNEIAGYAGVLHALALLGSDGHYGPRRKVCVMSYGSVSKGAIYALQGRGFNNIHVFTRRPADLVCDQNPDVYYGQLKRATDGRLLAVLPNCETRPLIHELAEADIIVNGILQDTDNPMMFVEPNEVAMLKPRSCVIDISCDKGMGFPFAEPTSFENPLIRLERGCHYYSVDHTPSYLWNAASREISRAVLPFLETVMEGAAAWKDSTIIDRAVEIERGRIRNKKIISFQQRQDQYPYCISNH